MNNRPLKSNIKTLIIITSSLLVIILSFAGHLLAKRYIQATAWAEFERCKQEVPIEGQRRKSCTPPGFRSDWESMGKEQRLENAYKKKQEREYE